jgi:hypothetical protein
VIAEAPVPVEGPWGARTSSALPVSFEVADGAVENVRFTFRWGFCGAFESALPEREPTPIRADGSWTYLDGRGPKVEATFVAPDRVEGVVTAPSRELPSCERSTASFVAVPGPVPPRPPGPMRKRPHRDAGGTPGHPTFHRLGESSG